MSVGVLVGVLVAVWVGVPDRLVSMNTLYNGQPVDYEELWTPPRLQYDGMVLTYEGGQWVGAFTQAPALPTL